MVIKVIKNREEFDQLLIEAIQKMEALERTYPGYPLLVSILNQLRAIKEWTAGGKSPRPEDKARLIMGLQADRQLYGDEPELTDLIIALHNFVDQM